MSLTTDHSSCLVGGEQNTENEQENELESEVWRASVTGSAGVIKVVEKNKNAEERGTISGTMQRDAVHKKCT
jgi:hypothetical protein